MIEDTSCQPPKAGERHSNPGRSVVRLVGDFVRGLVDKKQIEQFMFLLDLGTCRLAIAPQERARYPCAERNDQVVALRLGHWHCTDLLALDQGCTRVVDGPQQA